MMLYIPQEVRNQIAATGLMQQPKLKKIFQMKDLGTRKVQSGFAWGWGAIL